MLPERSTGTKWDPSAGRAKSCFMEFDSAVTCGAVISHGSTLFALVECEIDDDTLVACRSLTYNTITGTRILYEDVQQR